MLLDTLLGYLALGPLLRYNTAAKVALAQNSLFSLALTITQRWDVLTGHNNKRRMTYSRLHLIDLPHSVTLVFPLGFSQIIRAEINSYTVIYELEIHIAFAAIM